MAVPRLIDKAICLREMDWSESSQVVVLLTESHGKVRGLAKGSRRNSPSSVARFSGGINLLNQGQVIVTTRPATQLAAVTEWDLQADHYHLRRDLAAQWSAMYAAELAGAMLADEDPHPGAFAALAELLQATADRDAVALALLRYQWALLTDVGYQPELERDVATNQALPKARAFSFDPVLGGLTTRKGLGDAQWRVRSETVQLLRLVSSASKIQSPDLITIERANRLLCTYARALLDKELPTMRIILQNPLNTRGSASTSR